MNSRRTAMTVAVLAAILVVSVLLDLSWSNPRSLSLGEVVDALLGNGTWATDIIVRDRNAPRVVAAIAVGAGLAVSGAVMQAMFRNPMASPYILGLSSGASFGAALGIIFSVSFIPNVIETPLLAFVFCFGTMLLVYSVSRVGGNVHIETLLLAGIAVNALLSALVSFLTFISGDKLEGIVFWTLGDLSGVSTGELCLVVPVIVAGILCTVYYARDLNAMMLGDSHAMDLGIDVGRTRLALLIITTVITAVAVAFVGAIGFIGLVIPHIFRIILGPDNRLLIPVSAFGGAAFLVLCDYICRVVAPYEFGVLPVGVVTAIVGAPYFLYLVRNRRQEVGW